jgi:hypothetical protein
MSDRIHCDCGEPLGNVQNANWTVYPNPLLCPKCGADNTPKVLPHIMGQAKKGKKI